MNTLVIRADATSESGTGHVMRCLALAQVWQDKGGKVVFISHCETEALRKRIIVEGIDLISLDKSHPDPSDINSTLEVVHKLNIPDSKRETWFVVDGYYFNATYQKSIKAAGYKLLWIDDYGHAAHYYADLVLNQNISADPSFYINQESYTQLLMGTSYALLRREFKRWQGWQREISPVARKVLVTLGGGDPDNVTLKVIQALKQVDVPGLEARIVIGPANPHLELLKKEIGDQSRLHLLTNVADMPELMTWADLAIIQAGGTLWELLFMGCTIISYATNDFQEEILKRLDGMNVVKYQGYSDEIDQQSLLASIYDLALDNERRNEMFELGTDIIDGQGADRVLDHMLKLLD